MHLEFCLRGCCPVVLHSITEPVLSEVCITTAHWLLQVIHITGRHLLLPEQYPRFTLVGQATGSVRLAFQALRKLNPEVSISTFQSFDLQGALSPLCCQASCNTWLGCYNVPGAACWLHNAHVMLG